ARHNREAGCARHRTSCSNPSWSSADPDGCPSPEGPTRGARGPIPRRNHMARLFTRLRVALLATAVLAASAACGDGFDDEPEQQSGPANLQILIASSGVAET